MNEERLKFAQRFTEVAASLGYDGHGKQTRMADHYHLKQPSVKKWFDGEAMPDFEICADLCKRAKVHYEWFMTGRGPKFLEPQKSTSATISPPTLSLVYADETELQLLTNYREATDAGKKVIIQTAIKVPRTELVGVIPSQNKPQ